MRIDYESLAGEIGFGYKIVIAFLGDGGDTAIFLKQQMARGLGRFDSEAQH